MYVFKKMLFILVFGVGLIIQAFAQQPSEATQRLLERNQMFEPQIIEVSENVYSAVGYQVSTSAMIVGDDGIIIIDPGTGIPILVIHDEIIVQEKYRSFIEMVLQRSIQATLKEKGCFGSIGVKCMNMDVEELFFMNLLT